jgi:hypothetical protein
MRGLRFVRLGDARRGRASPIASRMTKRALFNVVGASAFSSDATIRAYARHIWNIVKAELSESSPVPNSTLDRLGE